MIHTQSSFKEFEECSKCHLPGRRKTLARYTDGHGYCFYCSHYEPRTGISLSINGGKLENGENLIALPRDAQKELPVKCLLWLNKYEITRQEVLSHGIMYSKSRDFLLFPYFGDDKQLLAWQGRDFKPEPKTKWFSQGVLEDVFHLLGEKSNTCVLVEDIVSAIKVARVAHSMPLFGTTVKLARLARLKTLGVEEVVFWLDPDAQLKAFLASQLARQIGLRARIVNSKKDPKEHSMKEIKEYLNGL